ncbi:MAG: septum site-determining protein MinC [Deltaproteobacteria bacterium]
MGIVVKGMTVPALLVKLDENLSVDENIAEIKAKLSSDFFKGSLTVIDFESANISDENRKKIEDAVRDSETRFLGYKPSLKLDKKSENAPPLPGQESRTVKVINKNLRSGQNVEHDGDVLIIGDVNPGSYVTASGNIIVMGTLSGIVHAGAGGDDSAVVIALKLKPQQLRIARWITRSPDESEDPEYPEKAYIRNNQMLIEKIRS